MLLVVPAWSDCTPKSNVYILSPFGDEQIRLGVEYLVWKQWLVYSGPFTDNDDYGFM
jgi:hypothetical protein